MGRRGAAVAVAVLGGLLIPVEGAAADPVVSWSTLTASDRANGDWFGTSVAISGDTVVVGAPGHDEPGVGTGTAYVYTPDGAGGHDELQLTGSDTFDSEQFGSSVGAAEGTIVVGAPDHGPFQLESGVAYVYTSDGFGGYDELPLFSSDRADADRFGHAVAVAGGRVVVGAPGADPAGAQSGAVYVYTPDGLGGYDELKLTASDAAAGDLLGASVAIWGDTVLVGAPDDDDGGSRSGSAYVFTLDGVGGYEETKLIASDATIEETFGTSVALSGDTLVVGATGGLVPRAGAAYVFTPDGLGGYDELKLTASDGESLDRFGTSVAVSGDEVLIGAPRPINIETVRGKAYRYSPDGMGGYRETRLYPTVERGTHSEDRFGSAVAVSGTSMVVGAASDDAPGTDAGSAALFGPPLPPAAGGYSPLTPSRLLDTRLAGQGPCVSGGTGRDLTVTDVAGIPADAAAVSLTVTVTGSTAGGYLTVSPAGAARPVASNLNFTKGQTVANMVIAKVGANGKVNLFAPAGCPHVIVDVAGSFRPGPPAPGGYSSLPPTRVLDTRKPGEECVSGAQGLNVTVAGVAGVPESAAAIAFNVTVTAPTANGYLTVSPSSPTGAPPPLASNLNYVKGKTSANMVIVKVPGDRINLFAGAGCAHVILDVAGWYAPGPADPGGFSSVAPERILDTRTAPQGPCVSGEAGRNLTVAPWPAPFDVGAVAVNITVTGATGSGYLTVSPAGSPRPVTSIVNYQKGQTIPALVIAKVGDGGQINLFASGGCPHLIVDFAGWVAPSMAP